MSAELYNFDGPVTKRIDRDTYSELVDLWDNMAAMGFLSIVEHDNNPEADPPNIFVQLLRITYDHLEALEKLKFDITRICSPELLKAYQIYKDKKQSRGGAAR